MYSQTQLAQLKWVEMKPMLSLDRQIALWMIPEKKNALSPKLCNSALEYATWIVQNTQRLKLNWKHHVLVYADDVNSMGKNINTITKNTVTILATNKAVGLEENAEETMNKMKDSVKMHNKSFANVQTFKDFGTALTNQDRMHEKIKRQIKFRKFLLPFGPDYHVFPSANQKCK